MKPIYPTVLLLVVGIAATLGLWPKLKPTQPPNVLAVETPAEGDPLVTVDLPETLSPQARVGELVFGNVCASCHGDAGSGKMGFGPPLVHKIYEPSHHGDMSFIMAVRNGVRAHHWRFGDMPAQTDAKLTDGEIGAVIAYIRELQRENGIE